MASHHHEDPIFQEKRKPKTPIKFKTELNPEQKEAKAKILQHTVTLLAGSAGSGKTFLACQIALEKLFMKEAEKVIITRPTVSKEEIGFLPGDLRKKWTRGYNRYTKTCTRYMTRLKWNNSYKRGRLR